jgi:hypothetical protein
VPDLENLNPTVRQRLILAQDELRKKGIKAHVTSGYRDSAKQAELYNAYIARGRTGLPAAPPGRSKHEHGVAIDLALADEKQRAAANEVMARHGFSWPLGKKDPVHYEWDEGKDPFRADTLIPKPGAPRQGAFSAAVTPPKSRFSETIAPKAPTSRFSAALEEETPKSRFSAALEGTEPARAPKKKAKPPATLADTQRLPAKIQIQQAGVVVDPNAVAADPLGGLFPAGGDPLGALRTFGVAVSKVDSAKNAALNEAARRVVQQGPGALLQGSTYAAAGEAARKDLPRFEHQEPLTAVRQLTGVKRGQKSPGARAAYGGAMVADYALSFLSDPSNLILGPASEAIGGVAKAALRPVAGAVGRATAKAGERIAATSPGLARAAGAVGEFTGIGAGARTVRETAKPYQIGLEGRLQSAGLIARGMRAATIAARKASGATNKAEMEFAAATGGKSRLQHFVETYVTDPHMALRQAAQEGVDPALVKRFGDQIVTHADETLETLERHGAIDPRTQSGPLFRPGGEERNAYLRRYTGELFGRPEGAKLGEVGATAFAGTNIRAVRHAATSELTSKLAREGKHVREVVNGVVRPGWLQLPDKPLYGALAGKQVPESLGRFLQREITPAKTVGELSQLERLGRAVTGPIVKATSAIKRGWLSNPATLITNAGSNMVAAEIAARRAGVNSARLMKELGPAVAEVVAYLRTGRMSKAIAEMSQHSRAFADTEAAVAGIAGKKSAAAVAGTEGSILRVGGRSAYIPPAPELASKALTALTDLHGVTERVTKIMLYRALRSKLSPEKAAAMTDRHLFDYADVPAIVELASRFGLVPFATFPVKSLGLFLDVATSRPDLLLRYPRLRRMLFAEHPGSEKDLEQLPPHAKGPMTVPIGDGQFIDLKRFLPFAGPLETAGKLTRGESVLPATTEELTDQVIGSTIAGPLYSAATNRNLLTHKPLTPEGAPPDVKKREQLRAFGGGYAPSLLPPYGRGYERLQNAAEGVSGSSYPFAEPQSVAEAVLQSVIGIPVHHAEGEAAKKERMTPVLEARGEAASEFLLRLADAPPAKNPYAEQHNFSDLKRLGVRLKNARMYLKGAVKAANNYGPGGKLTPEGEKRLQSAWLHVKAIADRMQAVAASR